MREMNTDIEDYIARYIRNKNITREEALQHSVVQEYIKYKMGEIKANKHVVNE